MKVIKPSVEFLAGTVDGGSILRKIELAGRVCYKSEDKITNDSDAKFVRGIIKSGHEAVLEHGTISVKFICDRGVTHEIVRHRIAAYCQESTRYCNYSKDKFNNEITVIKPIFWNEDSEQYKIWYNSMLASEKAYFDLLATGSTAQEARDVLSNSLKTEIVVTYNIREWRHFFELRTAKAAHPQMRELAIMTLKMFKNNIPVLFDDIEVEQ